MNSNTFPLAHLMLQFLVAEHLTKSRRQVDIECFTRGSIRDGRIIPGEVAVPDFRNCRIIPNPAQRSLQSFDVLLLEPQQQCQRLRSPV